MSYYTLLDYGRDEFTVNRSRFIGTAKPVSSNEEALEFVAAVRREFPDARHNVFAYAVREPEYARFSDDGEPSGTAGKPVLDVLRSTSAPLTDAAVVVTRYFGGILLGTGGLVRAYSEAARIALDAAGIVQMRLALEAEVDCPYSYYERVTRLVASHGGTIARTDFADKVKLVFTAPKENLPAFEKALTDLTNAAVRPVVTGERYAPFDV